MKFFFYFPILYFALFCTSCKKDAPTLNDKLDGSWRVTNYEIFDVLTPTDIIKNGIAFKSEGLNEGTIWWAEHREVFGTKDTIIGSYTLDLSANSMRIKWRDVLNNPYGMTEDATYNVNITDSLILDRDDPKYHTILVKAVRN